MKNVIRNNGGITLLEVLIAVTISVLVLSAAVMTYRTQLRSNMTQDQIVDMHQNMRSAIYYIERDIRMTVFDLTTMARAKIIVAENARLQFEVDEDEDGKIDPTVPNELISYALMFDNDSDGICESAFCDLGRGNVNQSPTAFPLSALRPIAENIDALNFVYLNKDGDPLPIPVLNPDQIATIQVTIVARSGRFVPVAMYEHIDNTVYRNLRNKVVLPAQRDNFRRIMLTTNIRCRNSNYSL